VLRATSQTDSSKSGTANVIIVSGGFEPEPGTQYTVPLNRQDGSGETESVTAFYGSPLPPVTVPALVGSTFAGYWTEPGGYGTQYYTPAGAGVWNWNIAEDTIFYAHWTPATCTVTFNSSGGGTPDPETKQVTYNETYETLATVSRTGYTFAGWYTAADGGTEVTESTTVTAAGNHTLWAHWTPVIYTP